jgi:hypothetical protein
LSGIWKNKSYKIVINLKGRHRSIIVKQTLTLSLPSPAKELCAKNAKADGVSAAAQENTQLFSNDLQTTSRIYHVKGCSFL